MSRKKKHSMPNFAISLNGLPLETITTFKYLGVLLSSDLSWSSHVHKICSKARQLLGLIYRRCYRHSNEQTLRQLYISLVLPHLEYASSVWSPHLPKDIALLEKLNILLLNYAQSNGTPTPMSCWTNSNSQH